LEKAARGLILFKTTLAVTVLVVSVVVLVFHEALADRACARYPGESCESASNEIITFSVCYILVAVCLHAPSTYLARRYHTFLLESQATGPRIRVAPPTTDIPPVDV
jgi:hypothetical protein